MEKKKAIITGITGQDGSYLSDLLLSKNYKVVGVSRRTSTNNTERIKHNLDNPDFEIVEGDITDSSSITGILKQHNDVSEFYNLAAQSVVEDSLLPVKSGNKVSYKTFKELWDNQLRKNKCIRKEYFKNTEIEVIDITPTENSISALGYANSAGNWFKITQISRHKWNGKVAKLSQKFGSVTVTPNHSLIDIYGNVVQPETNPWMLNIRKINSSIKKPIKKIINKDFEFEDIENLCKFIGAFVAEGHTSYNKANNSYIVGISEQNIEWLKDIQKALHSFYLGKSWFVTHKKEGYQDVYELQVSSKKLYSLLRKWCGVSSSSKKLPNWFTRLDKKSAGILLEKLIDGDGQWVNNGWRYTTSSYKLSCQLSWLITYLNYEYTVNEETNDKTTVWHFRSCNFYQLNQGDDGKKITWLDYDGYVYDITVDEVHNFTVGVGNIVVHNSHVGTSFKQPGATWDITGKGCINVLQSIVDLDMQDQVKFYQASSSEMFGKNYDEEHLPYKSRDLLYNGITHEALSERERQILNDGVIKYQDEETNFLPQSPYAIAKCAAHYATRLYREAYGLHASAGILFNHESSRRGENFVTKKITKWIAEFDSWMKYYMRTKNDIFFTDDYIRSNVAYDMKFPRLRLGNLDAVRDWGHAADYVEAMWLMLQQEKPDDYVICTGKSHSVRDFLDIAFSLIGIENWSSYVVIDPKFYRPAEVDYLQGRNAKAKLKLNWEPKMNFKQLVSEMVMSDICDIKSKSPWKDSTPV